MRKFSFTEQIHILIKNSIEFPLQIGCWKIFTTYYNVKNIKTNMDVFLIMF